MEISKITQKLLLQKQYKLIFAKYILKDFSFKGKFLDTF